MRHRILRIAALFLLTAFVSCTMGPDYALHPTESGEADDADVQEMRRRMRVRVVRSGEPLEWDVVSEDRTKALALLEDLCTTSEIACPLGCASSCSSQRALCTAHELMTWAMTPTPLELTPGGGSAQYTWSIPPQESAARAALARLAFEQASLAVSTSAGSLGNPGSCSLATIDDQGRTVAEALAVTFVEAVEVATQASSTVEQATLAVADGQLSDERIVERRTRLSLALPIGSRSAAAHQQVGGQPGLAASPNFRNGFCPHPRLSPGAREALELLRVSAAPPRVLMDASVSVDELLAGGWEDPALPEEPDGVLRRLAVLLLADHLATVSVEDFLSGFGLDRQGFLDARQALVNEFRAFGRSLDATLPPEQVSATVSTDGQFLLYAATRNPPTAALESYWAALARYGWTSTVVDPGPPTADASTLGLPEEVSLAQLLDAATSEAAELTADTSLHEDARDILAAFVADGQARRLGRAQYCLLPAYDSARDLRIHVAFAAKPTEGIHVVRGHDGLQCTVRGSIEGSPCDPNDYILAHAYTSSTGTSPGMPHVLELTIPELATALGGVDQVASPLYHDPATGHSATPVFLVTLRDGASPGPGAWREVAGVFVPIEASSTEGKYTCSTTPLVPEAETVAARAIAPSTRYCAFPSTSCAGIPLDQPIPLENELTSDSGGAPSVENSWQHYLGLASRAAAHADQLGDELIRNGLEMDVRAEQAIDELEDICGVSINLASIGNLESSVGAACTTSCADPSYRCVNGQCVLDPVQQLQAQAGSNPDAARLAACLGDEAVTPWVALGDSPVCFWWDGSDPASICANAGDRECPFTAENCATAPPPPSPYVMIPTGAALNFFQHHPEPPPPETGSEHNPPCAILAQLRTMPAGRARDDLARQVLTDVTFRDLATLRTLGEQLSWRAAPGDFSSVTLDGGALFSTGDPYIRLTSNRWPCAEPTGHAALCPEGVSPETDLSQSSPLFCRRLTSDACPSPSPTMGPVANPYGGGRIARARMNDMLARAVIAARIISGAGLAGLQVPYYPRTSVNVVRMIHPDHTQASNELTPRPPLQSRNREHTASDATVWWGQSGTLRLDQDPDPQLPVHLPLFDLNRATYYEVRRPGDLSGSPVGPFGCTSIPHSAEWSFCPYDLDGRCVEVFDDALDCDDDNANGSLGWDGNVGLIVRALSAQSDGLNPTALADLWQPSRLPVGGTHGLIDLALRGNAARIGRRTAGLEDLTRYWARTQCGANGECDYGNRHVAVTASDCYSSISYASTGFFQPVECSQYVGCIGNYQDCITDADVNYQLEFEETFDGNRAFIAPLGLTTEDILNGLELLCVSARHRTGSDYDCGDAPEINTVGDLFQAQAALECQAAVIHNSARMAVFRDIPTRAVDLIQQGGAGGVYGSVGGEYAAATSELASALIEVSETAGAISTTVDSMAATIGALRSQVQSLGIQSEIADWQLASTVADQVASCAMAAVGFNIAIWESVAAAGITCANSIAQIGIAARITDLQQETHQLAVQEALYTFERDMANHAQGLSGADIRLRAALARIEAATTRLQNLQRRGRRALARALMLDSDPGDASVEGAMGRQYNVNTVMRRRYNTTLQRYQEAHRNAVRLAFIAKLALEQRLGMSMDTMTEPMTLMDEPPADWHMDVCDMTGIDYDRIRDASGSELDEGYAGEYVGDYVRRLELMFESYSFDYPFQDGTDTTVLSLRDEVLGIRGYCPVEGPNLLYEAGQLDAAATSSGRVGWEVAGCLAQPAWPPSAPSSGAVEADPAPSCLEVDPLPLHNELGPLPSWQAELGAVGAYEIRIGQPQAPQWRDSAGAPIGPVLNPDLTVAWRHTPTTRLRQWVHLQPGRYRWSYYVDSSTAESVRPVVERAVSTYDPMTETWVDGVQEVSVPAGDWGLSSETRGSWVRPYVTLQVDHEGWYAFGFQGVHATPGPSPLVTMRLAAVMLEDITSGEAGLSGTEIGPALFFNTSQTRTRNVRACEDTTGTELRRSAFRRHCVGLCPDGYGDCPGALEQHCYYETAFTLSPGALQRGGLLGGAGFAFGNFNYRVDSVGVNVVGTGVRDCSASATPATCYGSGNLSFSVVHQGPYPVRNHRGEQYDAPLFTGRVERARALAAERYLTNPLSGADRSLAEPYFRHELRGRPLTGTYVLRIWDDPGLVWSNVEDIQIVLNYRYWTRQEE